MPLIVTAVCALFFYCFVPFAKWLFVDKTLEVYSVVANDFSSDDEQHVTYQGAIIDTTISPSVTKKGKVDTVVHRQTIVLEPQGILSDKKPKIEDVGAFSDGAGLLNAFFSFLAFIAVLITIYLQIRKDDNDKRNGARVQFEQEFFAMVGMLEDIVSHLRFTDKTEAQLTAVTDQIIAKYYKQMGISGVNNSTNFAPEPIVVEGRDVFKYIYKDRENYNLLSYVNKEKDLHLTSVAQDMCFDGTLDHYFRYLYRILKHIDESELISRLDDPQKERDYYAHVLRAQLSNYELLMLFYNGLLGENIYTIKRLIEKYAMFNNLRAWELGKHQSQYYLSIQEEELYEDPADYNPEKTYSVFAFWDEKKIKEIRRKKKEKNSIARFFLCVKEWFAKDRQQRFANGEQTKNTLPDSEPHTINEPTLEQDKLKLEEKKQKQNGKKAKKGKRKKSKKKGKKNKK